jgi:hypothetical protein
MANGYSISCQTWKWEKKLFSICSILSFWTVTSSILQVVGRKFHTGIFDSPFRGTCWQWLDKNGS